MYVKKIYLIKSLKLPFLLYKSFNNWFPTIAALSKHASIISNCAHIPTIAIVAIE